MIQGPASLKSPKKVDGWQMQKTEENRRTRLLQLNRTNQLNPFTPVAFKPLNLNSKVGPEATPPAEDNKHESQVTLSSSALATTEPAPAVDTKAAQAKADAPGPLPQKIEIRSAGTTITGNMRGPLAQFEDQPHEGFLHHAMHKVTNLVDSTLSGGAKSALESSGADPLTQIASSTVGALRGFAHGLRGEENTDPSVLQYAGQKLSGAEHYGANVVDSTLSGGAKAALESSGSDPLTQLASTSVGTVKGLAHGLVGQPNTDPSVLGYLLH